MSQHYKEEFKKKMVRLHEEGRTFKSITAEYGVSKASVSKWCAEYEKECQESPEAQKEYDSMKVISKSHSDFMLDNYLTTLKKLARYRLNFPMQEPISH